MAEWKKWSSGGRENPDVEVLELADGVEITLTDRRYVPDWTAELSIRKDDVQYTRTFTFIPDEVALSADPEDLWEVMRGLARKHAAEHLTVLRQLSEAALGALVPATDGRG